MENKKVRVIESQEVRRSGASSLVVTLTHPIKEMNLGVGDFVIVEGYEDKIVIREDKTRQKGKIKKTFNISPNLLEKFNGNIEEAIIIYNKLTSDNLWDIFTRVVDEHEDEDKYSILRRLIDDYISKWTKWYRILDRPLLKI